MTSVTIPISLHQPIECLIEMQGCLDSKWSDSFDGMMMTTQLTSGGFKITVLRGMIADQSALHGILNHIRDLGLPLLKVECLSIQEVNHEA